MRVWEFYLAASEMAFRHQGTMVFQIQLAKRVDTVPLTRDYIALRCVPHECVRMCFQKTRQSFIGIKLLNVWV